VNADAPRADRRFLLAHPAHLVALGFGSGLAPRAPGTAGTLAAWAAFVLLDRWLAPAPWAVLVSAALLLGWWACTVSARHLGRGDPGAIVWDEVVAFWIVLWALAPSGWVEQLAAFALFRYFDAAKPFPVGWADQLLAPAPGDGVGWAQGFGILLDDLVAAACTLALLLLARMAWT
jgi:phosphatidylglycerophosphatase A